MTKSTEAPTVARTEHRRPQTRRGPLGAVILLTLFAAGCTPSGSVAGVGGAPGPSADGKASSGGDDMATDSRWPEIESLVADQRYREAVDSAAAVLEDARTRGNGGDQTRALLEITRLRAALGEMEGAVRFLRDQEWPEDPRHRLVLGLFYGHTLRTYVQRYSWEIARRERVAGADVSELDLRAWTTEQISAEAQRAWAEVWGQRDGWGATSLGDLSEHIQANDYPPHIRGTLQDAVTYLWVELLADRNLWTPEQSNSLHRLDVAELVADPAASATGGELAFLTEDDVHPLRKMRRLLADLEAWHLGGNRPEAAFAARSELLRRLRESLSEPDDLALLRSDLSARLEALGSRFAWWSMGQAQLAEMVRDDPNDPEHLARARALAEAGAKAHPESLGGQRCSHIVAAIERPRFRLAAMATDAPGKRSLEVTHANLTALHLRAYRIDPTARLDGTTERNLLPSYREVEKLVASPQEPAAEWTIDLPPTPDFREHRTFAVPPMEATGAYVVVASARSDFALDRNQQAAAHVFLGDLVLLTRAVEAAGAAGTSKQPAGLAAYEVTARSGATGVALPDVEVELYRLDWRRGHRRLDRRTTGADGRVRFDAGGWGNHQHVVVARRGDDIALDRRSLHQRRRGVNAERRAALVYTDRSVYRPEQDLLWKVVAYRGEGSAGRFEVVPGAAGTVDLVDANGETVATAEVETNSYGSASGRFPIPAGRLLGDWWLRTSWGGQTRVKVEEYKRPTFEVELKAPEGAPRLNRSLTVAGQARYLFGMPVTGGQARWRVARVPVYPRWWWRPMPIQGEQILSSGDADLDADGRFEISFVPEADERLASREGGRDISYRYLVSVDVTDEGGETRSGSRSLRVGFTAVEARLEAEREIFLAADAPGADPQAQGVLVRRLDLDGTPRPGRGTWRLLRLTSPDGVPLPSDLPARDVPRGYQTPGDLLRPRWSGGYDPAEILRTWDDGEAVASGTLEHGEDGEARVILDVAPGVYRLRYATEDPFGAEATASLDLLVAGPTLGAPALPALMRLERDSVPVGETARILVASGLDDQELSFEVYRGSERVLDRTVASSAGPQWIEVPVSAEDRGGLHIALTAVRDHQLMRLEQRLDVPWRDRDLEVEFTTFRDLLRPGAQETWTVKVRGAEGQPLMSEAAELLAYMYDRSLDLFAPHQPPRPSSIFPQRHGVPQPSVTLGVADTAWLHQRKFWTSPRYPSPRGDRLRFYDSYPIGGLGRGTGDPRMMRRRAMPGGPAGRQMDTPEAAPAAAMAMADGLAKSAAPASPQDEAFLTTEAAGSAGQEPPEPPSTEGADLRSDFAETAFWFPHLLLDDDGSVSFEMTVPDSVTEWSVWVHALTRDLRSGSVERKTRSAKDLVVRPYLPRFFREGDRAELRVVVSNAGDGPLAGTLDFDLLDPVDDSSRREDFGLDRDLSAGVPFEVAAGDAVTLTFPVRAPKDPGTVAVRAFARAEDPSGDGVALSDGELRPLPILPGRLYLSQSRFAALRGAEDRELTFADLAADDDPTLTHESLVVTLDAQLFYSVLRGLPYLVEYPYSCTEQALNRFLSTGILSGLYDRYPAIARMAKEMAQRETQFERFDDDDPNRRMLLEETPWLRAARGGGADAESLINVLDPALAEAQREKALAELERAQTASGGFPWWPGGPPSPYMTLYLLQGFSRALEHGVDIPQPMVQKAWGYLARHWNDELRDRAVGDGCCFERVTFFAGVLSSYPDPSWTGGALTEDDRRRMTDIAWKHWRKLSPLSKGQLALVLTRAGRTEDAETVWASVMDSARTDPDRGTWWAPEERSWLWYNDTTETHAFALRVLSELDPTDERRHGIVQWLLLDKKLNHWKSTRATAEVIYALVGYLEAEDQLAVREAVEVEVGPRRRTFTFEPDTYSGRKNQVVIPGNELEPSMATVKVSKETPGFLFASATWHFATDRLPEAASGDFFGVERRYFRRHQVDGEWRLEPLEDGASLAVGDQLEVQLGLTAAHAAEYVHLRDPRGAGFEPVETSSGFQYDLGVGFYREIRDSATNFFFEWLPVGQYTLRYRLRATVAGTFRVGPAQVQSMYAPEFVAYSAGSEVAIEP